MLLFVTSCMPLLDRIEACVLYAIAGQIEFTIDGEDYKFAILVQNDVDPQGMTTLVCFILHSYTITNMHN